MGLRGDRVMIGYDIGETTAQISYCFATQPTAEPDTLPGAIGSDSFLIPMVLCKQEGENRWTFGQDAVKHAQAGGILIDLLWKRANLGERILVEETEYDPIALLTLFIKRSLGLLNFAAPSAKIVAIQFTSKQMEATHREVLLQATQGLDMKGCTFSFQEYEESFFEYLRRQPEELSVMECLLCDYREQRMEAYHMMNNARTKPKVFYVQEETYLQETQEDFIPALQRMTEGRRITAVFLIGENHDPTIMKEALRFLCVGRRVFQGTNLFSKGACYSLLRQLTSGDDSAVFLKKDVLKANVGLKVKERGKIAYYALLDAGIPWYEVNRSYEFYLQGDRDLPFMIAPLNGKNAHMEKMTLTQGEQDCTRISMVLTMNAHNILCVEVRDLGLGELQAPDTKIYRETIEL
ncbi:MAG: DUF5716 family protein [Lachnospiraceae bacterium]|jgi:hypothetical protein|nr:DUF5716 family protein [Lachnospiraceae bacterium]